MLSRITPASGLIGLDKGFHFDPHNLLVGYLYRQVGGLAGAASGGFVDMDSDGSIRAGLTVRNDRGSSVAGAASVAFRSVMDIEGLLLAGSHQTLE